MALGFWIPLLLFLGIASCGLLLAFVRVCDKV
jgi:hypothetical protein